MKIVHVTHHFAPCIGGVERVVQDMCRELTAEGIHNKVVALNTCAHSGKKLKKKEIIKGIPVVRIPYLNLKYYKIAPAVLGEVRDADIIHIHGIGFFTDFLAATQWIHKKPMIVSTHGGIFHTGTLGGVKRWYFRNITKRALKKCRRVLAVSVNDLQLFRQVAPQTRLYENGVELRTFLELGKEKEPNTFLCAGRLSRNKQIGKLLDAFVEAKRKGVTFKLWIAGEDWEGIQRELEQRVIEAGLLGEVEFKGKVSEEELKHLYSKAEFIVSASRFEGFGISTVEGMASRCIPVLNTIEAFSALVENERTGFLVDFDQPKEVAECIYRLSKLWSQEKKAVADAARESTRQYDWQHKINDLTDLYWGVYGRK